MVYIKDSSFLPAIIELNAGDSISFSNEDAVTYELHCRDNPAIPETRIRSKKVAIIKFPKHGRYEITDVIDSGMKCLVEVIIHESENTPKANVRYFPLSTDRTGAYDVNIKQTKPPPLIGSACKLPIHKTDINVKLVSKSYFDMSNQCENDAESDPDEELNNLKSLRRLCKIESSVPSMERKIDAPLKGNDNRCLTVFTPTDNHSNQYEQDRFEASNMLSKYSGCESAVPNLPIVQSKHIISIKDFDFDTVHLDVRLGDIVEFRLSSTVPLHAEHVIYGSSEIQQLCFESPLLQIHELETFEFSASCEGEVVVSCRIFCEMQCIIKIHPCFPLLIPGKICQDVDVMTGDAVVGMSHQLIADYLDLSSNTAHTADEDSFYDSDDILTEDEKHLYDFPVEQCLRKGNADPSFSPVELHDSSNLHTVYIDEFSFKPSHLICKIGESVCFILDNGGVWSRKDIVSYDNCGNSDHRSLKYSSDCCLECEGVFERVHLSNGQPYFVQKFLQAGHFEVRNAVFSFSCCSISVSLDSPLSKSKQPALRLFGSFIKTDLPSRPIFHLPAENAVNAVQCVNNVSDVSYLLASDKELPKSEDAEEVNLAKSPDNRKSKTAKKRQNKRKRIREAKQAIGDNDRLVFDLEFGGNAQSENLTSEAKSTISPRSPLNVRSSLSHPASPERLAFMNAWCDHVEEFSGDEIVHEVPPIDALIRIDSCVLHNSESSTSKEFRVHDPQTLFPSKQDLLKNEIVSNSPSSVSLLNPKTSLLRNFLRINTPEVQSCFCHSFSGLTDLDNILIPEPDSEDECSSVEDLFSTDDTVNQEELFFCSFFEQREFFFFFEIYYLMVSLLTGLRMLNEAHNSIGME